MQKTKRRTVKKSHPWKNTASSSFASRKDVHFCYVAEGVTKRLKRDMKKGTGAMLGEVLI